MLTSPRPKMEVVLGMVGQGDDDRRQLDELRGPPASRLMPLGETLDLSFDEGQRRIPANADRSAINGAHEMAYGAELTELKAFLKSLAILTGVDVDLFEASPNGAYAFVKEQMFRQVQAQLDACRRLRPDEPAPDLEPPFITALRALLDRLGRPLAERSNYISVRDA